MIYTTVSTLTRKNKPHNFITHHGGKDVCELGPDEGPCKGTLITLSLGHKSSKNGWNLILNSSQRSLCMKWRLLQRFYKPSWNRTACKQWLAVQLYKDNTEAAQWIRNDTRIWLKIYMLCICTDHPAFMVYIYKYSSKRWFYCVCCAKDCMNWAHVLD